MSAIKLGSLVIRTLAKPFANSIKNTAKTNPRFRDFCINVAQTTHSMEMKLKMNFLGYKREVIRPLNEARAIDAGATFLSESVLFSVGASIIIWESARSSRKESARRDAIRDALDNQKDSLTDLKAQIDKLESNYALQQKQLESINKNYANVMGILDEILTVSLGLRKHSQYDGQKVPISIIPGMENVQNNFGN